MFLAPALAPISLGCGLQGEGQRCDTNQTNAGNDDCDTSLGLACRSRAELGGNSDICCPQNADHSWSVHTTSPDCKLKSSTGASSSSSSSGGGGSGSSSASSSSSGMGGASS